MTKTAVIDVTLEILKFRRHILSFCFLVCLVAGCPMIVATELGYTPILRIQENNNIAFIILCILLRIALKRRPSLSPLLTAIFLGAAFALFTAASIYVPGDEMRFCLHFAETGASFLLLGILPGWLMTAAVLTSVIGVVAIFGGLSPFAMTTFAIALLTVASIFSVFSAQAIRLFHRLAAANMTLHDVAMRDPLTELPNRRSFSDMLDVLLRNDRKFASIMVDLDRFKEINDGFGHDAGDRVLTGVASLLVNTVRADDFVARIGGDEFVILLPDAEAAEAIRVAEKVRAAVEAAEIDFNGDILRITASIGVAASGICGGEGLPIRRSDVALYEAKRHGRNQVVILADENLGSAEG